MSDSAVSTPATESLELKSSNPLVCPQCSLIPVQFFGFAETNPHENKVFIFYDGKCGVCYNVRRAVTALDWFKRCAFADLHNETLVHQVLENMKLPPIPQEKLMEEMHVAYPYLDDEARIAVGFEGVRRIMRNLPLTVIPWAFFSIPGIHYLGKKGYEWISKNRLTISQKLGLLPKAKSE